MAKASFYMGSGQFNVLKAKINKDASERVKRGRKTMTAIAKEILAESQLEVPKELGVLASTGYVEQHGNKVEVGYGGEHDQYNRESKANASEYMLRQHEDLSLKHPNGGKAKFLEDPVRRASTQMETKLANAMRG